jgi:hypothetical protein
MLQEESLRQESVLNVIVGQDNMAAINATARLHFRRPHKSRGEVQWHIYTVGGY